ncbi:hypothetical protein BJX76DRAFT_361947 [Aspergillus varians]
MLSVNPIDTLDAIPGHLSQFVQRFYALLDGDSSQDYSEIFDEDAEFVNPVGTYKGRQVLKSQRQEFWDAFPSFTHQPLRVYTSPVSPLDLIVINSFKFPTQDGRRSSYTAAEFKLVEKNGTYLIQRLEIFMDPTVFGWK